MDDPVVRDLLPEYLLGTLDEETARRVEEAVADSPELQEEASALYRALYALPEELAPEPVPERVWQRLQASLLDGGSGADAPRVDAASDVLPNHGSPDRNGKARPRHAASGTTAPAVPPRHANPTAGNPASSTHHSAEPHRRRARSRLVGLTLALAASLAMLAGVGAWGWRGSQERADLASEQRIIAYWMRNPNLRIVSLDGIGPGRLVVGQEQAEVPPGVVCILPDGRGMLLQPYAAPPGSRYVLRGESSSGTIALGSTDGRFLLFEASGLDGVELALEGGRDEVVARATF